MDTKDLSDYLDKKTMEILKEMLIYEPVNGELEFIFERARIGLELVHEASRLLKKQS